MKSEVIAWYELPADGMPDAETTVLVSPECGEVTLGWWDGEDWRYCENGGTVEQTVRAWADVPVGVPA